ncbi:MAG: glycosyltransferase family 39 protein [Chloroflexales bacterium]|nr:glycosyltransferase family 39 protein [Chloroflexales bacterium]
MTERPESRAENESSVTGVAARRSRKLDLLRLHVRPLWFSTLLFGVVLLPRLYRLADQSLWLDEGSTWQTIQQSWLTLLADLFSPVSAYPLYHLFLKLWVTLAGNSEWALRLPSALAGAGAVVVLYFAALELQASRSDQTARQQGGKAAPASTQPLFVVMPFPLIASLLLLTSPFAIWYAQEAKVYSLLLLFATLLLWSFLRALRLSTWRAWLICALIALISVSIHRLAVLLVIAAGWAWLLTKGRSYLGARSDRRRAAGASVLPLQSLAFGVLFALSGGIVWAMARGLGSDRAATGAYIAADPVLGLWLTFVRFSVNRGPGDAPWWGLLLWGLLFGWGLVMLLRRFPRRNAASRSALVLFCFLFVPLALFLIQLTFTRLYEARYVLLIYPAWLLLLAYPLIEVRDWSFRPGSRFNGNRVVRAVPFMLLLGAAIATSAAMLVQPKLGLFSGDPVKEQYREVMRELARRVHPDDLVVLHPAYLRPLYDYYMPRLTADPPPAPVGFGNFKQGQEHFGKQEWDMQRREAFQGRLRSFLLIAPDHAKTVDQPQDGDEYGLVGLYFQYSQEQRTWPCGIWRFNGVHLLCQEAPEAYYTGDVPQPAMNTQAVFAENLQLLGYTLKSTGLEGPGVYRAGGTLPITLFWDVARPPEADYSVFLHLCQDCSVPPAASDDGPPLSGYLPTSTWLPGKPARDDRSIPLPRDLPPGRYTLLLGLYLYRPGDVSPNPRLPVIGDNVIAGDRAALGEVIIVAAN